MDTVAMDDLQYSGIESHPDHEAAEPIEDTTEKKATTAMEKLREFGEESTLHGIRYVMNTDLHVLRRCFWGLVVLAAFAWFGIYITKAAVKFSKYPVNSVVSLTYEPMLNFPAVTICNYNQFRKSNLTKETEAILLAIFGVAAKDRSRNKTKYVFTNDFNEITTKAAHQMTDMLVRCTWGGVKECDYNDFPETLTDFGVCHTFNNPVNKSQILKVKQPGSKHGLFVRLDVQQSEYTSFEHAGAGFKVLLHPQGERPLVSELGFSISPGFETYVSVVNSKVKNLPYPFSDCRPQEKGLRFTKVYTVAACFQECKEIFVTNECNCKDYRYLGDAPGCSPQMVVKCIYPTEVKFHEDNRIAECDCPMACESNIYNTRLSHSYFPSDHVAREVIVEYNLTYDSIRKNYLDLYVFFEELSYSSVTQVEAYSLSSLVGDIGGAMGLMVGMSIITVVEFVDFLLTIYLSRRNKYKSTNQIELQNPA